MTSKIPQGFRVTCHSHTTTGKTQYFFIIEHLGKALAALDLYDMKDPTSIEECWERVGHRFIEETK